ncbi:MAG: hypothetical protein HYY23_11365 [Verrucomicrobia bacterium]|nr:hypothetical protein [Verrucomicrobiota bacterium]
MFSEINAFESDSPRKRITDRDGKTLGEDRLETLVQRELAAAIKLRARSSSARAVILVEEQLCSLIATRVSAEKIVKLKVSYAPLASRKEDLVAELNAIPWRKRTIQVIRGRGVIENCGSKTTPAKQNGGRQDDNRLR